MNTGITNADFTAIHTDFKRTVSYQVLTKSVDGMGNETSTFAAATNVDLVFFLEENRYIFDKEGLTEVGDAYIIAKTSVGIKRYDQFTLSGETYYIQNVIHRYVLGTAMCDYAVCFKVQ